MRPAALVWLGADLRIGDNPALETAIGGGYAVIPVFIWAPEEEKPWAPGAASRWWLRRSLESLAAALARRGSRLIVRRGPAAISLASLAAETGARRIFFDSRYEPGAAGRVRELETRLREAGITLHACPGNTLFEPGSILSAGGKPLRVFGAFWRACLAAGAPAPPSRAAKQLPAPPGWPPSVPIPSLELDRGIHLGGNWQPGEAGASERMRVFLESGIESYARTRDHPAAPGTSLLSPHLHHGEISARQVWHAVREAFPAEAAPAFLREICWREFSCHLLFHFPYTPQEPLDPRFRRFPWRMDAAALQAWTGGKTGYPLVDAGMRQLRETGWMHNRVRMLVASFLVKHLLLPWQEGAAWFWERLVDADLANNTMGWQWSAGCGADAVPYFRIFNPVIQGEKFDPEGAYVRRWVPELAPVPARWIHRPWEAPAPPEHYPPPVVEHGFARRRALAALARIKA